MQKLFEEAILGSDEKDFQRSGDTWETGQVDLREGSMKPTPIIDK